jgi:hypothetical protein
MDTRRRRNEPSRKSGALADPTLRRIEIADFVYQNSTPLKTHEIDRRRNLPILRNSKLATDYGFNPTG